MLFCNFLLRRDRLEHSTIVAASKENEVKMALQRMYRENLYDSTNPNIIIITCTR